MRDVRDRLRASSSDAMSKRYRLRSGVRLVGDSVLFDGVWGNFHRVSETARQLLELLADGATADRLSAALQMDAETDSVHASTEATKFLADLRVLGLVEETKA